MEHVSGELHVFGKIWNIGTIIAKAIKRSGIRGRDDWLDSTVQHCRREQSVELSGCYIVMREVMTKLSDSKGFSLIELMISVAIIAVMSAIAFPTLQSLRARAKESEMRMHLAAIRTCEETYKAENDAYYACPAHPAVVPIEGNRISWDNPPPPVEWDIIGFSADSAVLYQYSVINVVGGASYTATAEGDADTDSQTALWTITPQSNYRPVWDPATDDH